MKKKHNVFMLVAGSVLLTVTVAFLYGFFYLYQRYLMGDSNWDFMVIVTGTIIDLIFLAVGIVLVVIGAHRHFFKKYPLEYLMLDTCCGNADE